MKAWTILLAGLIVWAAHFFTVYGAASVFPGSDTARWLALAATLAGLIANGLVLRLALQAVKDADPFDRWLYQLAAGGAGLSLVSVAWQGLPAIAA